MPTLVMLRMHVMLALKHAIPGSLNPSVCGHAVTLVAVGAPPTASRSVTFYASATLLETTKLSKGQVVLSTMGTLIKLRSRLT
jgi:hypothetical protein